MHCIGWSPNLFTSWVTKSDYTIYGTIRFHKFHVMVQRRMALAQWLLYLINTWMSINSRPPVRSPVIPSLICLFILLHISLSICVWPFFYMSLFSLSFFSVVISFVHTFHLLSILLLLHSTFYPFLGLFVLMPVRSPSLPLAYIPFSVGPRLTIGLSFCSSISLFVHLFLLPSLCPPICLFFFIFLFVRSITRLLFLLSSRSSN